VYCRKVTKNFGQSAFLSACEIEHGQFRALFAGWFCSKMQNGRTSLKNKKKHSAVSPQPKSRTFHRKGREGRKERKRAGEKVCGGCNCNRYRSEPTPFWDHRGCGGIPREGGGAPRSPRSPTSRVIGKGRILPRIDADERGSGIPREGRNTESRLQT
jgi:hypothetical protein